MDSDTRKTLEKQHYGLVGSHSAVKICTWTKKSLRNKGFCYKQQFYGIRSHLCCQMTPSVGYCQNNCVYCWRTLDHSLATPFDNPDEPETIYNGCITQQRRLLSGFGGEKTTDMQKLREAQNPQHFAISLSGEPTMYPKLSQLIKLLHAKNKTTFLVTNGMLPGVISKLEMPTQLYVSLSSPNQELFTKIHKPLLNDGWQRLMRSLEILSKLRTKTRTTIRMTLIKHLNMCNPEQWAQHIETAHPQFVEIKGYMFVGASRQRMSLANMPLHDEIRAFAEQLESLTTYNIIDEKPESRVVLLMQHDTTDRVMHFD